MDRERNKKKKTKSSFRHLETDLDFTYFNKKLWFLNAPTNLFHKFISKNLCALSPSFAFSRLFLFTPNVYVMLYMTLKWNVRQPPKFSTKFLCQSIYFRNLLVFLFPCYFIIFVFVLYVDGTMRYIFKVCTFFIFDNHHSNTLQTMNLSHNEEKNIFRIGQIWTNFVFSLMTMNWWTFDMKLICSFISFLSFRQMNFTCFFFVMCLIASCQI